MDEYDKITQWLFEQVTSFQNVGQAAYKPGLDTMLRLCRAFGNPHLKFKSMHVGGTNGKGSTSSLIASSLTEAGVKTGLYTSPHLVDFRERIRINGEMISKAEVVDFINRYRALDLGLEPSFFELTTIMAFDHFARHGVEYAVVEVGLGGRLDSTNVITPEIAIITNISLDHTALLGNSEVEIAGEKAGIIKPGVPVVIGRADEAVEKVFVEKATQCNAPITLAWREPIFESATLENTHYIYRHTPYGDLRCPLCGDCQPENANTALHALRILGICSAAEVALGFEHVLQNTGLKGRWTITSEHPLTVCDTGHNPGGWQYLGPRLQQIAAEQQLHIVLGFVADKDVSHILDKMPHSACYYFCSPSVKRGLDSESLKAVASEAGLCGDVFTSVSEAYEAARKNASPDDCIFVGGSTFVVADFLSCVL